MLRSAIIVCIVFVLLAVPCAEAQKAAKTPPPAKKSAAKPPKAAKAPKPAQMKVTVLSVTGIAHKRRADVADAAWAPVKAGDVLGELTVIRTGLGASVVLKFSDRGQVTVKSATKVGIKEFTGTGMHAKARLGLKYGSMRAKVDSSRGTNDFQVATPVATLSVRGTEGVIWYWWDLGLLMCGCEHTWRVEKKEDRKRRTIYPKECTDGNLTRSIVLATRRRQTLIPDPNGGMTGDEFDFLRENGGGRALFNFAGGGTNSGFFPQPNSCSSEGHAFVGESPGGEYETGGYEP